MLSILERIIDGTYDPVTAIVDSEVSRGNIVVRPGNQPWFSDDEWNPSSIASIRGVYVRLILLHANQQGRGSFTRTVEAIRRSGLTPLVIDPTNEFANALRRRGWKGKTVGKSFEDREDVWRCL